MFDHPLEERCHEFAKRVRRFCRRLKRDVENIEDIKQLVRASGSVGANYIEAKECMYFLGLIELFENEELEKERIFLVDEANQLKKIFSSMLIKLKA